jgi:hypothetical protein
MRFEQAHREAFGRAADYRCKNKMPTTQGANGACGIRLWRRGHDKKVQARIRKAMITPAKPKASSSQENWCFKSGRTVFTKRCSGAFYDHSDVPGRPFWNLAFHVSYDMP